MFNCKIITTLPIISKRNTKKVTDIDNMLGEYLSLINLPDISKWLHNIKNMS